MRPDDTTSPGNGAEQADATGPTSEVRATRRAVVGGAAGAVIIATGMGRAAAQEPSPASSPEALGDPAAAAAGFS